MDDFWHKQEESKPLFPDIEWNRPENKRLAGKLGIIGGNKLGFSAVASSYGVAEKTGAGEIKILVPDALKKIIPNSVDSTIFAPTNRSGGLSADAQNQIQALESWSDVMLFIGDTGKNSETAILYENFLKKHHKPVVITRDAVDLVQNGFSDIISNDQMCFVVSFSQLQRIFRSVYYPKILTFNMHLAQLAENLHKFTITYPITVVTFHDNNLVIANSGKVVTQSWDNPMAIWRGDVAVRAAVYLTWTPQKPLEAITASIY